MNREKEKKEKERKREKEKERENILRKDSIYTLMRRSFSEGSLLIHSYDSFFHNNFPWDVIEKKKTTFFHDKCKSENVMKEREIFLKKRECSEKDDSINSGSSLFSFPLIIAESSENQRKNEKGRERRKK